MKSPKTISMSLHGLDASEPRSTPWRDEQNERPARRQRIHPVTPKSPKPRAPQKQTEFVDAAQHWPIQLDVFDPCCAAASDAGSVRDGRRLSALVEELCTQVKSFGCLLQSCPATRPAKINVVSQDNLGVFLSTLNEFCNSVKTETASQRTSTAAMNSAMDRLKVENQRLRTERNQSLSEVHRMKKEGLATNRVADQVKKLQDQCIGLKAERDKLRTDKELRSEQSCKAQQAYQSISEEKISLTAENNTLRQQISMLENTAATHRSAEEQCKEKYRLLKKRKADDDGRLNEMEKQISEHRSTTTKSYDALGRQYRELERKHKSVADRNSVLEANASGLQSKIQQLQAAQKSLEEGLDTNRRKYSNLSASYSSLEARCRGYQASAAASTKALQQMTGSHSRIEAELSEERSANLINYVSLGRAATRETQLLKTAAAKETRLREDVCDVRKELGESRMKVERLSRAYKKLQEILSDRQGRIESLEAEFETVDVTCCHLRDMCVRKDLDSEEEALARATLSARVSLLERLLVECKDQQSSSKVMLEFACRKLYRSRKRTTSAKIEVAKLTRQLRLNEDLARTEVAGLDRQIRIIDESAQMEVAKLNQQIHLNEESAKMEVTKLNEQIHLNDRSAKMEVAELSRQIHLNNESAKADVAKLNEQNHLIDESAQMEVAKLKQKLHLNEESAKTEVSKLNAQIHLNDESAKMHIKCLQYEIDHERSRFLCELRTILGLTADHLSSTLHRLSIPQDVVLPGRQTSYGCCLHERSTIRGRRFTDFAQQTNRTVPMEEGWNVFFHSICLHIIKLELCIDDERQDICIELLWDIWGNLDSRMISRRQIDHVVTPLAHVLEHVLLSCSEGRLSTLAFWLASQTVGYLLRWQFTDLHLQVPLLPWSAPATRDVATLITAAYSCIQQGQQTDLATMSNGLLPLPGCAPDHCVQFPASLNGMNVKTCAYQLPSTMETIWVMKDDGGRHLVLHDHDAICKVVEMGLDYWVRLGREDHGGFHWLFPQIDIESWVRGKFGSADLGVGEASLLQSFSAA
ncbi:MAG: hypothetical protein Q9210_006840 [Variospora velana]